MCASGHACADLLRMGVHNCTVYSVIEDRCRLEVCTPAYHCVDNKGRVVKGEHCIYCLRKGLACMSVCWARSGRARW